jgi:uncharacterized membrane protein (DUF2068 family)
MAAPSRRELGIRLIVLYKTAKAVLEIALAAALVGLAAGREIEVLRGLALHLRADLASRWSLLAGRVLGSLLSQRGVHLLETGLVLDGLVSALEGFSLWRGYRWGPWLVVAATAIPLPLEAVEIAQKHSPWRVALALVNVAVVAYLSHLIAVRRRAKATAPPPRAAGRSVRNP